MSKNLNSLMVVFVIYIICSGFFINNDLGASQNLEIHRTSSSLTVNGNVEDIGFYNINGNNYFKLRDMALILKETDKSFNIEWHENIKSIILIPNEKYASSENISQKVEDLKSVKLNESEVFLYNKGTEFFSKIDVVSYNINGHNYFKLRDILHTLDVWVDYDKATDTILIDTSKKIEETDNSANIKLVKTIERDYDWYIDQGRTGNASANNCGPSCAAMTAFWQDSSFRVTVDCVRDEITPNKSDWWTTNNISEFYDKYGIKYKKFPKVTVDKIIKEIDNKNIVLLCLNTSYINYTDDHESKFGRFYKFGDGHFLIIKGYIKLQNEIYFQVYDSNSWNQKYSNGEYKGKDRYYLADEVVAASVNWWDNYFVIYNID